MTMLAYAIKSAIFEEYIMAGTLMVILVWATIVDVCKGKRGKKDK